MDWGRWIGQQRPSTAPAPARPAPGSERVSPGLAALFEGLGADRGHAVLDLGPAAGSSLEVYGRFARWVRFADVLAAATSPELWPAALAALPPNPERPYDLVVAWDTLDRLPPGERPRLVERLAALSAPGARLFLVVESAEPRPPELLRFTLEGPDRVRFEPAGEPPPVHRPVLPAEVRPLLGPFEVSRAFSTRVGWREYLAVRKGTGAGGG